MRKRGVMCYATRNDRVLKFWMRMNDRVHSSQSLFTAFARHNMYVQRFQVVEAATVFMSVTHGFLDVGKYVP